MAELKFSDVADRLFNNMDDDPVIKDILKVHSGIALALAWLPLPAAGPTMCFVNICGMYMRINAALRLPFTKSVVKSVAGMIGSNLAGYVALSVGTVGSELLKFIPVLGSVAGALAEGAIFYAVTGMQGKLYCEWLRFMLGRRAIAKDGSYDEKTAREAMEEIFADKERIRDMFKRAKEEAKKADYKKYRDQAMDLINRFKNGQD